MISLDSPDSLNADKAGMCRLYALQLSKDIFRGKKVTIKICDEDFEPLQVIKPLKL